MFWFIVIAALMWLLQCILGIWQFKNFNRHFREMRARGRVVVGKAKGKWSAGSVVLFCIDRDLRIVEGKKMQGLTTFARIRSFEKLNGEFLLCVSEDAMVDLDSQTRKAVRNAADNYREFAAQEIEKPLLPQVEAVE